ncbi:MAG: hypothetical protein QOF56_1885, partial [Acidobacteriaceae bacterium]|nr:hypothetical protein [Acidobacteriaceae bacterium]
MAGNRGYSVRWRSLLFMGLALVTMWACTSGSASKDAGGRAVAAGS